MTIDHLDLTGLKPAKVLALNLSKAFNTISHTTLSEHPAVHNAQQFEEMDRELSMGPSVGL